MDTKIVEDTYEQAIIKNLSDLGYEYLYGPDVERKKYHISSRSAFITF